MTMQLLIKRLREDAKLPKRATKGSAGYDLCACLDAPEEIAPGQTKLIPTGIALALPDHSAAAFLYARSGLASKAGLAPANCVGVVDSDYRGEVKVPLHNHSEKAYTVSPGERIAQMVIAPVFTPELVEVNELEDTARADGGFGSTGRS